MFPELTQKHIDRVVEVLLESTNNLDPVRFDIERHNPHVKAASAYVG